MPKGSPMIVILKRTPKAKCERLIHIPPRKIHKIFIKTLKHPPESGQLLTSFPNGHNANEAIFKVCIPKGIPIMVIIIKRLDIRYSTAVNIPPKRSHNIFIKRFILSILRINLPTKINVYPQYKRILSILLSNNKNVPFCMQKYVLNTYLISTLKHC